MDLIVPTTLGEGSITRSTTATYYDSTGKIASAAINTVRNNYNPASLSTAPVLLWEDASANLMALGNSEDFLWQFGAVNTNALIKYNNGIAPDGRKTADKLSESVVNGVHSTTQSDNGTLDASKHLVYSVYAKAAERTQIRISDPTNTVIGPWIFNLSAGTVISGGTTYSTASIVDVGNGWYRCVLYVQPLVDFDVEISLYNGSTNSYVGDGVSGVLLWGQMLEYGTAATSYIPSTETWTGRSSVASYINSSGFIATASSGAARSSYTITDLTIPPKLLLEPAATNLLIHSATFLDASWNGVTNATTTSAGGISPTGANDSYVIADASAVAQSSKSQTVVIANNSAAYVFSIFIKKTTAATTFPGLSLVFDTGGTVATTSVTFNTNTGVLVNAAGTPLYTHVSDYLTYYRVSIGAANNSTGNTRVKTIVYPAINADGSGTWLNTTTGSINIWGAQLESNTNISQTSYIPTVTVIVNRLVDDYTTTGLFPRAADVAATTGLLVSNVPETDYPAWNIATTYDIDVEGSNSVVYLHHKYASLRTANTGHNPATDTSEPPYWLDIGATNQYAMIDGQVGTQTTGNGNHITAALYIGAKSSFSFINMIADSIQVSIISNYTTVYSTTIDMTGGSSGVPVTDYTLTGLSAYADGIVKLDIYSASSQPACGNFIVGTKYYLGSTETSPTIGIIDYSITTTDQFGNPTLTQRGYAKRMNFKTLLEDNTVDIVARVLAQNRATNCVWNGNTTLTNLTSNNKTSLIVFGYYKDWEIDVAYSTKSYLSGTIQGII